MQLKVYLSYDRFAYFEKDDGDFRITFDKNITTRREDIRLEHGSYGKKLLPDGKTIEFKQGQNTIEFTIPRLDIFEMVEVLI